MHRKMHRHQGIVWSWYRVLALNRQPHPGPGLLILCQMFNDTHVMINQNNALDHDGPKPVPTLALDAVHRDREVRVSNSILLFLNSIKTIKGN